MHERLRELEEEGVRLSPVHRVLLTTDGSVTKLLEALFLEPVTVEAVEQRLVRADADLAALLGVEPGAEVNRRMVNLRNSKRVLAHAVSHTPLSRLHPSFQEAVLGKDLPIGRILADHRVEARREVRTMDVFRADERFSRLFGIPPASLLLRRNYHIFHGGEVLINITEVFPWELYR
jgi:beta-ribofuranosylaminobenzene 5'-phosphate synthase